MTVNNVTISACINGKIKEEATAILAKIGLTPEDLFRVLMTRIATERSLPFEVLVPNTETISALEDAIAGSVKSFTNVKELMDDLHADD